jgi:type IV pilus assembly protein PilA
MYAASAAYTTTNTTGEIIMLDLKRRLAEARKADEGFTLIELAVVILIIGILLLLAIPSFLGVRKRAQDKGAQATLRTALTHAKTSYGDSDTFINATATAIVIDEPGFTAAADATTDSTSSKEISVLPSADRWAAAVWSKSGKCFYIVDSNTVGTKFGKNVSNTASENCSGTDANAASDNAW